jgi:hypothetical protein
MGVEFFHMDGQTDVQRDMTELIVTFGNFANAPKNLSFLLNCSVKGIKVLLLRNTTRHISLRSYRTGTRNLSFLFVRHVLKI